MAILEVLHFPDERLRNKALAVSEIDDEIKLLAGNMLETMYAEGGIGLAATQVNVAKRVVVIDLSEDKNEPLILVNPVVVEKDGIESMREGCLSVPDYFDIVERAEHIKYQYKTLDNETIEAETGGLLAVCIQHEIDHLNGKLFIDYLSPLKRQRLKKKLEKQEKLQQNV
ncbi:MAG: peptide deformylase [Pseudomonadota bacterium]